MLERLRDLLLRVAGWPALFLHGDPLVFDRFLWVRRHLAARPPAVGRARVLDAGCGNGGFSIYAARLGHEVLGLSDTSRELEDARRRAALLHVTGARFSQVDLRELSLHADQDVR